MEALANHNNNSESYDHVKELENFIATRAGVKGLVDSGIAKVPRFFIQPPQNLVSSSSSSKQIPIINLKGLENEKRRKEIVNEIRDAAETWGFFQMINHGVPIAVIDSVLEGVKRFNEQPERVKMEFYHGNGKTHKVRFFSNGAVNRSLAANWKDSLVCQYRDQKLDEKEIPQICRKVISEYMKYMFKLKDTLSELLSEALGLRCDYLADIECMDSTSFVGNYYPTCPEPNLVLGTGLHSDPYFLTIVAQDNVGGLQLLHQNQWLDVPYLQGSLVANIADLMQLVSNDKFKSVVHRVLAGKMKSRVSTACFFFPSSVKYDSPYGPLKELLSEKNPPIYQEVRASEFLAHFQTKGFGTTSTLLDFKLPR